MTDWGQTRLEVIEFILRGWTALDLQIQHNPHDKQTRQWLPQPIAEAMSDDPDVDELDEWLCVLLDTNFNLICEDDSCFEVARMLVDMERIIRRKDETRLREFVDRLPKCSGVKGSESHWAQAENESSDDDDDEVKDEFKEERRKPEKKKQELDEMDVEEGWSVAR